MTIRSRHGRLATSEHSPVFQPPQKIVPDQATIFHSTLSYGLRTRMVTYQCLGLQLAFTILSDVSFAYTYRIRKPVFRQTIVKDYFSKLEPLQLHFENSASISCYLELWAGLKVVTQMILGIYTLEVKKSFSIMQFQSR